MIAHNRNAYATASDKKQFVLQILKDTDRRFLKPERRNGKTIRPKRWYVETDLKLLVSRVQHSLRQANRSIGLPPNLVEESDSSDESEVSEESVISDEDLDFLESLSSDEIDALLASFP